MTISYLTILGSIRESTPPRPARLGYRVAKALRDRAGRRGAAELIDPLEWPLEQPFKPHFAYATGSAPPPLEALAQKIRQADAERPVGAGCSRLEFLHQRAGTRICLFPELS